MESLRSLLVELPVSVCQAQYDFLQARILGSPEPEKYAK